MESAIKNRGHNAESASGHASEEHGRTTADITFNQGPILQIPAEIACQIFGLCLSTAPKFNSTFLYLDTIRTGRTSYSSERHDDEPLFQFTLGSVCRTWRQIVWSNPSFWCHISVTLWECTPEVVVSLMEEWLARSAQLPLSISLDFDGMGRGPSRYYEALMEVISSSSDRWSIIHLRLPQYYLECIRIKTPQRHIQVCSVLLVVLGYDDGWQTNIFEKLAVERLEVHNIPLQIIPFRFDAIKHFHQGGFDAQACVKVLRRSPHLLTATFFDVRDVSFVSPITNSSIRRLEVVNTSDTLWKSITLPSLRELRVGRDCELQSVSEFVCRSQCPLQKVSFGDLSGVGDVLSMLKSVPSLEELEWTWATNPDFEESALEQLGKTADIEQADLGRQFLPNLSKLSIQIATPFLWTALVSVVPLEPPRVGMVRRPLRRIPITLDLGTGQPESSLQLDFGDLLLQEIDVDTILSILRLIRNGIDITVEDLSKRDVLQGWIKHYISKEGKPEWLRPEDMGEEVERI